MEKLIIIWSWPAGHTAAIYAARANLQPLMFEWFMAWGIAAGGQLTTTTVIENFPWFPDGIDGTQLMLNMRQQSLNSGVRIETKTVDKLDLSQTPFKVFVGSEVLSAQSIIIATWATATRMHIPWEDLYRQKGISACAVCDGALPMFREKTLVVVWWWDSAIEEAIHLTHFASQVIMLVRRDVLRASQIMQDRAISHPKIKIMRNTQVREAIGEQFLTWVKVFDSLTSQEDIIQCSWLFYAIGHKPATDFLDWQLKTDESGYIITQPWSTQTSIPWVFAAWDVQDKTYRQAITSAWSWCMAAIQAHKYLDSL